MRPFREGVHPLPVGDDWWGDAFFSKDSRYRYYLARNWNDGLGTVVFVMLNPSTAGASDNDPSVRRCMGYARQWGFNRCVVVNLFAIRSTNPKKLYETKDPIGKENDRHILSECRNADLVICAWGLHSKLLDRGREVRKFLREWGIVTHYLKLSKDGVPMHPLYLKSDIIPTLMK